MVFIPFKNLLCLIVQRNTYRYRIALFGFFGMYSMASFTTFSLVILYRSLTLHPISVWKMKMSLCISSCGVADRSALKILSLSSRLI